METSERIQTSKDDSPPALPSLIKAITDHEVSGFDSVKKHRGLDKRLSSSTHQYPASVFGIEEDNDRMDSVSISMPPSPDHMQKTKRVLFDNDDKILGQDDSYAYDMFKTSGGTTKNTKFYSQPLPKGSRLHEEIVKGNSAQLPRPTNQKLRDKRFDSFKTWSGGLERQLTNLRGRARESEPDSSSQPHQHAEMGNVPVDRYFDALEGPELDVLRPSEQIILPEDKKWPFLLRFPISSFGICLGVSSQAIMWKTLASTESTKFLQISPHVNQIAWFISVALVVIVFIIYSLKLIFYFEAVRREYHHPIRVNFFFAPWIALLFLCLGVPPSVTETLHKSLWYILMSPFLILELKIYGQWMSGGQRRLSKVANPSNHLSIVGNFVGALLGANMGLKEGPIFFFAVGIAHYTVLFVTLYQRLPTNETLPRELHPVFFLFVAAPSVASMAWAKIVGHFDFGARITYFIAMFLYFSLAIRVNFFRGFTFSLAWWAYTFPMTGAAIASIRYSSVINCTFTKTFAVALCIVATLTVAALLVTTVIHAFVLRDLFPNDIAIAISDRRPKGSKSTRRWYHRRTGSSETNIQHYLKFSDAGDNQGGSVTSVNDPAAP